MLLATSSFLLEAHTGIPAGSWQATQVAFTGSPAHDHSTGGKHFLVFDESLGMFAQSDHTGIRYPFSSEALAQAVRGLSPDLEVRVSASLDELASQIASCSQPGDLVLAMGAGDVNSLWDRLAALNDRPTAVAV